MNVQIQEIGKCDEPKIIGVVFISRYMIKKYGAAIALNKLLNRKKYKYIFKR